VTPATRATCTKALHDRLDAIDSDLRTNTDYYDRETWRGRVHRLRAAREIREIRRALRELRFVEWAVAA
jgi:hypothetical protein